ncbi:MAG: DUF1127 domain-containing protein [Rhodospirillales bacterium]|nr:DUF1127 domain-containing protein [Rhodospirillales bacterium]
MTARLGGWVVAGLQRLGAWMERARARRQLAALDDHMLKDIGLSRCDAVHEADKPFWLE